MMNQIQPNLPTILITGASGGLAETVATLLEGKANLIGVDTRALPYNSTFTGKFYQMDYHHRRMTEIFENEKKNGNKIDYCIHLGRIPVTATARKNTRFNINVLGTRHLLELCEKNDIKNIVVVSTYHVYGADPKNHYFITENDPLRASLTFPELSDAVELDHITTMFLLAHPKINVHLLRPTNIIGQKINNQVSQFLRAKVCPTVIGFDPLLQFVHETDIAKAIIQCLEVKQSGIYNVSGEGMIPFSKAIEISGAIPLPIPSFSQRLLNPIFSLSGFRIPKHLLDYFKYPTIVSDAKIKQELGYAPEINLDQAIRSLKGPPKSLELTPGLTKEETKEEKTRGNHET